MRILVLTAVLALATGLAAAQTAPAEPKNYSIDPWHINVPKPVAKPVTGVTEKIPGSRFSYSLLSVRMLPDERCQDFHKFITLLDDRILITGEITALAKNAQSIPRLLDLAKRDLALCELVPVTRAVVSFFVVRSDRSAAVQHLIRKCTRNRPAGVQEFH